MTSLLPASKWVSSVDRGDLVNKTKQPTAVTIIGNLEDIFVWKFIVSLLTNVCMSCSSHE